MSRLLRWKEALGRKAAFVSNAFPYHPEQDCFVCPAGKKLQRRAVLHRGHGVRTHVYRARKGVGSACPLRNDCAPPGARPEWRRSVTRIEEPGATTAFKAKMKTAEAQQIYVQRSRVAEFVHAWMKERCGLQQFRCRGRITKVQRPTTQKQFLHTFLSLRVVPLYCPSVFDSTSVVLCVGNLRQCAARHRKRNVPSVPGIPTDLLA